MTYGTTQIEMKMLWLLSRGTKGGRTEEISTETHGLTGSRIYSLTGPGYNILSLLQIYSFLVCFSMCVHVGQPPDHLNHQPHHPGKTIKVILYLFSFFHNYIFFSIVSNVAKYVQGMPVLRF